MRFSVLIRPSGRGRRWSKRRRSDRRRHGVMNSMVDLIVNGVVGLWFGRRFYGWGWSFEWRRFYGSRCLWFDMVVSWRVGDGVVCWGWMLWNFRGCKIWNVSGIRYGGLWFDDSGGLMLNFRNLNVWLFLMFQWTNFDVIYEWRMKWEYLCCYRKRKF